MAEPSPTSTYQEQRCKRKLIQWSLLLGILAGLGYFLGRAVYEAREAAHKSTCHANLFLLAYMLQIYHDTEGTLPPTFAIDSKGNRLYSWRVLLMPYLDQAQFYETYDLAQPWDHPANLRRANEIDFIGFTCWSGPNFQDPRSSDFPKPPRYTDYVAVVGPGTAFPGPESVSFDQITDGRENTILLVEIAGSTIHWSEPRDLDFETMSFKINDPSKPSISSAHADGPGVVFADGRFYRLSESIPPEIVKGLLTISGGEKISRRELIEQGFLK